MDGEITSIEINVNGVSHNIAVSPGEMLVDLLRKKLKLTGTKVGCNEAECGACTVLLEGVPVLSCTYPAAKAHKKHIVTIEGLEQNGALHPLQEAFILHGAVQCGFCIPGQIMTAAGLLRTDPEPSSSEIRGALKDTLCRCGGYPSIERAIEAAAKAGIKKVICKSPYNDPLAQEMIRESGIECVIFIDRNN